MMKEYAPTSFPGSLILPPPGASEGAVRWETLGTRLNTHISEINTYEGNEGLRKCCANEAWWWNLSMSPNQVKWGNASLNSFIFYPLVFLIVDRSPLLGACNSHNKPMQRHFYRPVYFSIFFQRNRPVPVFMSTLRGGLNNAALPEHVDMSTLDPCLLLPVGYWGSCGDLNWRWIQTKKGSVCKNAVTGIWRSCRLLVMGSCRRINLPSLKPFLFPTPSYLFHKVSEIVHFFTLVILATALGKRHFQTVLWLVRVLSVKQPSPWMSFICFEGV